MIAALLLAAALTAPGETAAVRAQALLDTVVVYPNPFKPNDGLDRTGTEASGIVFAALPPASVVRIYTPRGEKIFTADVPGGGDYRWSAAAEDGRALPSGLYLWVVETSGRRRTGRLAILR